MIKIFGPENPERFPIPKPDGTGFMAGEGVPVQTDTKTLHDALSAYEHASSVTVKPYDGSIPEVPLEACEEPKYFFYTRQNNERRLVDIHVLRNSIEICPKQDVLFALQVAISLGSANSSADKRSKTPIAVRPDGYSQT